MSVYACNERNFAGTLFIWKTAAKFYWGDALMPSSFVWIFHSATEHTSPYFGFRMITWVHLWDFGDAWLVSYPWLQDSWGQHGAHLGPTGPRGAPCWPHELCYLGLYENSNNISGIFLIFLSCLTNTHAGNDLAVACGCAVDSARLYCQMFLFFCACCFTLASNPSSGILMQSGMLRWLFLPQFSFVYGYTLLFLATNTWCNKWRLLLTMTAGR